jgi:UDP-GlcNAc:undecaprenyl-phosphate/decaprenyl-phosphate GlcNAc-1-phosphate transferase
LALFYLAIFTISLLLSFVLTRCVRDQATSRGWLVTPSLERHLHRTPLPRLGGVAIFSAFLLSTGLALAGGIFSANVALSMPLHGVLTILGPAFLVFLLGVYDDVHPVGPYVKFGVQGIAATILFAGGLRILDLPVLFGARHFPWYASLPLTIIWVLAITNAFNLIDGLDGLAAGSALFSTMVVFVAALVANSPLVSIMTLALAGAILGFLRFNFNPATIFLGDSGSLFIGFMLSALALRGAEKSSTTIAVAIPIVSFGLPILETGLSIVRRFVSGRPVFTADRDHIHHKLLQMGMSHRRAVIVLYAVSAVFALLSLFLLLPTGSALALVLTVLGIGVWLGVQRLNYLELGELRRVAVRTMEQRQVFVNNLAIRRATEELKVTRSCEQIASILVAAFNSNDFDGFELCLSGSPPYLPNFFGLRLTPMPGGGSKLSWRKPGGLLDRSPARAWKLTLDLVTTGNRNYGSMILYQCYGDRGLHIDLDLLTSLFPVALADALDRASSEETEAVSTTPGNNVFAAARAG